MFPVVAIMGRATGNTPTKVGAVTLPPRTVVATPLFSIHNTSHNWDSPLQFKPER